MAIRRDREAFSSSYNKKARGDRKCLDCPRDWFYRKIPVICSFTDFSSYPGAWAWTFICNTKQKGSQVFAHYF